MADVTVDTKQSAKASTGKSNGNLAVGKPETLEQAADDLAMILASLQTMRDGDFSVRLPVAWTGLKGKIADTFNDIIAANERIALELNRVGQAIGKEGRTRERTRFQHLRAAAGSAIWKS
jgi:hypothetical protein